ncbi:MAG: hypothetical protein Q8L41_16140 [Anaerolineales bacterium]|nr:hypothetical protein [Anaerolineales bacterium]
MNIYSHILPSMQEEAAEKLDELLMPNDVSDEFKKISVKQQVFMKNRRRKKIG